MSSATADDLTKLCMACSKWVDVNMKSCHCGHVFKQVKSINGKRFTEGRFYQESEDPVIEPKRKQKCSASIFCKEKITYLSGFTYEEMVDTPDKKERRRRRRKPMHLINSAINNDRNMRDIKNPDLTIASNGGCRKGASHYPIEQPLIQVLREINNKITNQRRLWIDLDS